LSGGNQNSTRIYRKVIRIISTIDHQRVRGELDQNGTVFAAFVCFSVIHRTVQHLTGKSRIPEFCVEVAESF
jgi:hypothetical protein